MAQGKTAEEMAAQQRNISVAEFFERNRHLLGFDNKRKALLTTIKEACDNSLDACEEAGILPDVSVEVVDMGNERFRVIVEDNGPGIVKKQIPNIFAKLLYGSKFHSMKQSLTADEPIIIMKDGKVQLLPIGEFVDSIVKSEDVQEIYDMNILVPAFDKEKMSYSWKRVSHVIKHKRQNEVLKIKANTGRTIKVTGCHSLFVFNEATKKIEAIEARLLQKGSYIVAPKSLPCPEEVSEINLLDYITFDDVHKLWMYVYDIESEFIKSFFAHAEVIHKKTSKSRKFYRFKTPNGDSVDVLDDSFKQYITKKFLPLKLVLQLGIKDKVKNGILQTYYHGKLTRIPLTWQINSSLMRFLGLFVAEGHTDVRQVGFTFGHHEEHFVNEISKTALLLGSNVTIEKRDRSYRVKVFGGIISILLRKWCGRGAKNKRVPEFTFRASKEMRQTFLDALYQGDGCFVKKRNCLSLTTVSKSLANDVLYLWLMQSVLATTHHRTMQGLGTFPSVLYRVDVHGQDILVSNLATQQKNFRWKTSYRTITTETNSSQILVQQHLCLLKIKDIEVITEGYDNVYDLSVPEHENFVGGMGGIACHNSRGQQGIGISAAVLYAQLTTGKPARITSKTEKNKPAHYFELHIDTQKNEPEIVVDKEVEWAAEHGTRIELDLEASYQKGDQSVDQYLKATAIVNPHAQIVYVNPKAEQIVFARAADKLPQQAKEIKPHPYGVELGTILKMLKSTESRTLQSFLMNEFSRVGSGTAKEICQNAALLSGMKTDDIQLHHIEQLVEGIKKTKIIAPPTDCIVPIGAQLLEQGLRKEVTAEFYTSVTRAPEIYRGIPFCIEIAVAYGGTQSGDQPLTLLRFANRVPLLYQQSACAVYKSIIQTNWRAYGLQQSQGALPVGQLTVAVHLASVWPPFTSEAKEAIAHYPEIIKEMKLALQECGRKLGMYVRKKLRVGQQRERANIFEKYIPEVADSIAHLSGEDKTVLLECLKKMIKKPEILQQLEIPQQEEDQKKIKLTAVVEDEESTE
ncbi:DNA topoisomerase VI subunit B [Candidatus Woesearchaeota archaeon]|nr:DNA topoisomerase VI subunit B [Candidatus Woesearchaeota archaeon]